MDDWMATWHATDTYRAGNPFWRQLAEWNGLCAKDALAKRQYFLFVDRVLLALEFAKDYVGREEEES